VRAALLAAAAAALVTVGAERTAHAADVDPRVSSRENPYACLGGYQALSGGGRSLGEIEDELRALLGRIEEEEQNAGAEGHEASVTRAVDLCVVGKLKARLGHGDAADYFERAIAAAPREPGYELFAGMYWAGVRGARRPLLERAEQHFYSGVRKLERLRARRQTLAFHDTVDDWLGKQLMVLYQADGAQILPWKAYHHSPGGLHAPGLAFSSQLRFARDTRDFFYNSEMRQFTGEAAFAASDLRAARTFDDRDIWDLVRAPQRFQTENRLRLRHNWLGAIDAIHDYSYSPASQIRNFYDPNQGDLSDVTVFQLGLGYERTFSLYPLFDFRLAGSYRQGRRQGVVEFEPDEVEHFRQVEVTPSFSRFIGAHTLTLDLTYVLLDFDEKAGGVVDERLRRRDIRAVRVEYAMYAPVVLPGWQGGELGWTRTATRGWHFYAGAVDDRELWGLHTVVGQEVYGGTRFGGADWLDLTVQGTYYRSSTETVNPNNQRRFSEPGLDHGSARLSVIPQVRIVDQEAIPGVPSSLLGFGLDMMNLVFPIHVDRGLSGRRDFENVRAGTELWMKLFGTGIGGAAVLITLGYDFQYFHQIGKAMHLGQAALRLGWGRL
jgi:hypothetical protein